MRRHNLFTRYAAFPAAVDNCRLTGHQSTGILSAQSEKIASDLSLGQILHNVIPASPPTRFSEQDFSSRRAGYPFLSEGSRSDWTPRTLCLGKRYLDPLRSPRLLIYSTRVRHNFPNFNSVRIFCYSKSAKSYGLLFANFINTKRTNSEFLMYKVTKIILWSPEEITTFN